MVRVKYLNSVICFCLTLAFSVLPAQALDAHKTEGDACLPARQGLFSSRQSHKEDNRSLSHYIVGVYCESLGDLEGAVDEYQKAQETDPASSLVHLNLASIFIQKDNLLQATEELKNRLFDIHGNTLEFYWDTFRGITKKMRVLDKDYGEWFPIVSSLLQGCRH